MVSIFVNVNFCWTYGPTLVVYMVPTILSFELSLKICRQINSYFVILNFLYNFVGR